MKECKNILIVRTDRIGDVVLTTPVIKAIKDSLPETNIYFLANNYTKDLIESNKDVKETIILGSSFIKNLKKLKKYFFDLVIIESPSFKISLLFYLLRTKYRVGTGYRWYSFMFNKKQFEHRRFGNKHELDYNINLLAPLGIRIEKNYLPVIVINEEDRFAVDQHLKMKGVKKDDIFIVIHPGSGGSAMDFPFEKLMELVKKIDSCVNLRICFTGTSSERELVNRLNSSINYKGIEFVGELALRELAYLIKRSSLFISNSTGPIHIAAAVGTFIIGFYPPVSAMSSIRWGPFTEKRFLFIPSVRYSDIKDNKDLCKKCEKEKCSYYNCMNSISVDEVFTKAIEILKQR